MNSFRPPNYSPGMNQALMDDPMALTFMMFGSPLLQQAAGPQNFIPHLVPSQALSDQFLASRYQRDQLAAAGASNEQGNAAVASRFLGLRALVTDSPATDLNREQAAMFAQVANNPIVKSLAAMAVGPENLEALMFGRQGDPGALANAANQMNFFRKDTMGGTRMTAESMTDFSRGLYQTLYGEEADIDQMHGFMAGQTGEVLTNLFQRGQLPQSLGELNPAERVRAISASQRDDKTMNRLAEQFGHSEMLKQEDYASATTEERAKMLEARKPEFRKRLDNTFQEIDRFNAGDARARSPQDIEKMDGYGMSARNVDAQRVGKVAKDYMGALDAVREIFGDNGAGDAPMSALIEALDEFSAGSIDRLDPNKVENSMRQMRLVAQDAGMNLESIAMIGAHGTALGQMHGTPAHMQMAANMQTMQNVAAMQREGMFSRKLYGDMTEGEAIQETQERIYRGQKSEAGKSMAALNRMYQQNKEMYAGTELEAAMKAYNDPSSGGTYEFGGQQRNLAEIVAQSGRGGALGILQASGGNAQTFNSFYYDPATAEKYSSGLELEAQKREMQKHLGNQVIQGELIGRMTGDRFDALRNRGFMGIGAQSEEDFERERNDMAQALSRGFAQVIVEETGGMSSEDRAKHLEKRHVDMMAQYYESRGVPRRQARQRAEQASQAMFGETEGQRIESLSGIAAQSNAYVTSRTGQQLTAHDQINSSQERVRDDGVKYADRAEREKRVSMGQKSSFLQRSGEVLEKMGKDPNYSGAQAAKDLLNVQDINQMQNRYAPEMAAGIGAALDMYQGARNDTERTRAERILTGMYEGANDSARTEGVTALAEQAFGRGTGRDADMLRQYVAGASDVTAEQLSRRLPRRQREQMMAQADALRNAKRADLSGAGFSRAEAIATRSTPAEQVAEAVTTAPNTTRNQTAENELVGRMTGQEFDAFRALDVNNVNAQNETQSAAAESDETVNQRGASISNTAAQDIAAAVSAEQQPLAVSDTTSAVQQARTAVSAEQQPAARDIVSPARFSRTAVSINRAAAADQLHTIGAEGETAEAVNQATAFHRADARIDPESAAAFRTAMADEEAGGPRVGGAIDTAMFAVNTAASAASVYDSASTGLAALNGEDVNHGQFAASTAKTVLDTADNVATGAGMAARAASRVSGVSAAASFGSRAAATARFLAPVSKVAPFLSPLLGGVAGAFEGAENGRGAIEGGILGMLTGDASSGSMMSDLVGIEKGSDKDKAMGMLGAAGGGAMTGAAIGAAIGTPFFGVGAGIGAAAGAVIGGVAGLGAEAYKIFTEEDPAATAATQAVQQTVNTSQADRPPPQQAAEPGGGGKEISINGTLSLRGLQEAMLSATGNRPMETPEGGVPVFGT